MISEQYIDLCANTFTVESELVYRPCSQCHMGPTVVASPLSMAMRIVLYGIDGGCHGVHI